MSSEILQTQEIGSLSRHKMFKEELTESEKKEIIQEGLELGVENIEELEDLLNKGGYKIYKDKIEEFASLFAIRMFEKVGLDIIFNGEQPRKEMYHYPLQFIKGFRFVGEARVFDNQYFPRAEIFEEPILIEPYHLKEFLFVKSKTKKKIKIPITGAYTLADWSYNLFYQKKWIGKLNDYYKEKYEAKRELAIELARKIIRKNILALVENGAEIIQIDEPAATTVPEEIPIFVETLIESTKGINCKFNVHICFSRDYRMLFPSILEAKNVSQLALEMANRDTKELGLERNIRKGYSFLEFFKDYSNELEIGLGVIDVHTDFIEPVDLIKDRIRYAIKLLKDPNKIYINPDCGLRTRTWKVARAKLENMVKAVKELRKEFS
jgi:5-methyltetrahydropteroyltriglutamate--homocysteine methyltransferase